MKKNRFTRGILAAALSCCLLFPVPASAATQQDSTASGSDIFYDDFNGNSLDTDKWLIADKQWGGNNGGVVPENVSVSDGTLKLEGHGNLYTGDVDSYRSLTPGGIRTGAAIATRDYYSSGSYEVVAKVAPELGACSAMWTFEYEEYYPGSPEYEQSGATGQYSTVNHEIDIEIPTANATHSDPSFECGRFNTYTAENRHNSNFHDLPYAVNDGKFHTYRFDWHTGDDNEQARVDYYVDDIYVCTSTSQVPSNASRFWLGLWFPSSVDSDNDGVCDSGWSGTANFDTTVFEIDSVKITPYHEAGDTTGKESFPYDGWAVDSFPDLIESERFNHIKNGDFSSGKNYWKFSGDADIKDEAALLSSGATTDEISQTIDVKQRMTYKISADITTDGTAVTLGARKQNGTCNTSQTYTTSGHVELTFVTEPSTTAMDIYAQVLRYQKGNAVKVDNITVESAGKDSTTVTPDPDPIPDPDPTPDPDPDSLELIKNGSFDDGSDGWDLSGSAKVADGSATLSSGSDTDSVSQKVTVTGGTTYTLTGDVTSSGSVITFGVRDYNGRYTTLTKTADSDGTVTLTFTTAQHISQIEVFAEVLRYQKNNSPTTIDNISLKTGGSTDTPEPEPTPAPTPEPTPAPDPAPDSDSDNLLTNGSFTNGTANWTLTGSATISSGKALLTSGSDTDDITQAVSLEPETDYTLTSDIVSKGCAVDLIIENHDGKYSKKSITYTSSTSGKLTFTTGKNTYDAKVVIRVLRYQKASDTVEISNVKLHKSNS